MRPDTVAGHQANDSPAEFLPVGRSEIFKYLPCLRAAEQVLAGVREEIMQVMTTDDESTGEQVVEVSLVEEPDPGAIANQDTGRDQRVDLKPWERVEQRSGRKQRLALVHVVHQTGDDPGPA